MTNFTVGQRVRIVDVPDKGQHLKGHVATVLRMGPFSEPGDVMVKTEGGQNLILHDHQLEPVKE